MAFCFSSRMCAFWWQFAMKVIFWNERIPCDAPQVRPDVHLIIQLLVVLRSHTLGVTCAKALITSQIPWPLVSLYSRAVWIHILCYKWFPLLLEKKYLNISQLSAIEIEIQSNSRTCFDLAVWHLTVVKCLVVRCPAACQACPPLDQL